MPPLQPPDEVVVGGIQGDGIRLKSRDEAVEVEAPAFVVTPENQQAQDSKQAEEVLRTERASAASIQLAHGQRQVNLIWELSQAMIALSVVITTCAAIFIARTLGVSNGANDAFPPEWWTILGLVIGFYFGRTNHARIGDDRSK